MHIDIQAMGAAVTTALAAANDGPAVGDTVITWMAQEPVTYGGPDAHGSSFVMVIGVGKNGMTVKCPPDRAAPADTPLADAKDPRIQVVRLARSSFHGSWQLRLDVDGPAALPSTHKTKTAAVNEGQRRLAIVDWHAARSA